MKNKKEGFSAEIICVGTEILMGNIVNSNAAFLSRCCADAGISVYHHTVVGDNPKRLETAIKEGLKRSDILILSGGLGPTKDDLTKEITAETLGLKMELHEEVLEDIKEYFSKQGREMSENNVKQAYFPVGCKILYNVNGTAPGLLVETDNNIVILLPGPPVELKPMFLNEALPLIKSRDDEVLVSKMVKIVETGESDAEMLMLDLIEGQSNPTIAPYAKTSEVHFRITAKAENEEDGEKLIEPVLKVFYERFGDKIYTTSEAVDFNTAIVNLLKERGLTVATAESCTGGLVASSIVEVPSASKVFNAGYITYSNEEKEKRLGVPKEILDTVGAVSKETAEKMAEGAAKISGSQIGLSTTGFAGPDGGTDENPVGTVYISCFYNGKTKTERLQLSGNREKIRLNAAKKALVLLRRSILDSNK